MLRLRAVRGGIPALAALGAGQAVVGGRFTHSTDLVVVLPGDPSAVVNLADEVVSPNQVVLEAGSRRLLLWSPPVPGAPVVVDVSDACPVDLSTPLLPVGRMPSADAVAVVATRLHGSWFAGDDGQRFGLPALDAALAGHPGRLLGLGPGLTPSGDDALVALAAWSTARGEDTSAFAALAQAAPGATTPSSAMLLRCAVHGQTSRQLNDLLLALAAPDLHDLPHAVAAVAAVGHSSGADALFALHRLFTRHRLPTRHRLSGPTTPSAAEPAGTPTDQRGTVL